MVQVKPLWSSLMRGLGLRNEVPASNESAMRQLLQTGPSGDYRVTDASALRVSTVYACLARLSGAVLQLPLHQYQFGENGDRQRAPMDSLSWLLNESPHEDWTSASWKEWIVHCVALRGDQHTEIVRSSSGAVRALRPLHPDHVTPRRVDGRLAYRVFEAESREHRMVSREDMLHFCGYGFDGTRSLSIIQWAARQAVHNALAAGDHSGRTLAQGAMPKHAISYPQKLSKDQKDLVRETFYETYTNPAQAIPYPLVLTEGAKVEKLSISAIDLQLLDGRKFERDDICQAFGVPPVLIGDTEKASSWGTGIEQITLGFVLYTLKPHLVRWEEELNRKFFRRAGRFVEFELDGLLRGDTKAQADAFRVALGGPGTGDAYMTVNEVRRLKNLPPSTDPASDRLYKAPTRPATPGAGDNNTTQ